MKYNKKHVIVIVSIAALLIASVASSQNTGPKAKEILAKVQAHYGETKDFTGEFVQTTAHKLFSNKLERAYGKVYFRKSGVMRWVYERPEPKYFIYDGEILWVYEPEVPQIFKGKTDSERLKKALAFLIGSVRIADEYKVSKLNEKKFNFTEGYVLKLIPKAKGSPFKHIELYVSNKDFHVQRSVVVDHENNRNRFDFNNVKFNNNLEDALFEFKAPAGVPVIQKD